ncbi:ComEC/Rec2 family competence protein [Intestinibacillus massiliensis]|nr:ComEC/Rec2 family competence protein [Intestinibacillus massiliensis]
MKRPVIPFAASFAAAVWAALHNGVLALLQEYWLLGVSAAVLIALCCFAIRKIRAVGSLLCAGVILGLLFSGAYTHFLVRPVAGLDGKTFPLTATVEDYAQVYEENQRVQVAFPAKDAGITGFHPRIHTLLYVPLTDTPLVPGDRITATADFYTPTVLDGFARKEYYDANGFYILGSVKDDIGDTGELPAFSVEKAARAPIWSYPVRMAAQMKSNISQFLPTREAGFLTAVLLGDKSGLQDTDQQAMKKAGLSHATAVSGMHIGFLVGFFYLLFGRKFGTIFSIAAILIFIPMAGASPSVIRAGIMYLMAAIGFCLGKESDGLNALCLALLVLLLANPYAVGSVSLQLSFAASLGLILFSRRIKIWVMQPLQKLPRWFKKVAGFIADGLICSVCALCFTAPVLFSAFGYVSLLAPIANLLTVGIIGVVFVLGLVTAAIFSVCPPLSILAANILTPCIDYILGIAYRVSAIPFGLVYWDNLYGKLALLCCFAALILIAVQPKRIKMWLALSPVCAILVVLCILGVHAEAHTATISFLPSGSGQTILLADGQRDGFGPILIDCSASGHRDAALATQSWLEWRCMDNIDTLVLTAVDKTHARSVPELLQNVPVGRIIIPQNVRESEISTQIQETAAQESVPILIWDADGEQPLPTCGDSFQIYLSAAVDRKLVVRIQAGEEDILVLHSLTQKMLQALLDKQPLQAETIVLSESNLSDARMVYDAMDILQPQTVILQSGYSTLDTLCRKPVRNTMLEGEITFRIRQATAKE